MSNLRERGRQWRNVLLLSSAGLTLAFSVAIGFVLGYWIDTRWKQGWATIVFGLIGIVAGFRELFRAVSQVSRDLEESERRQRSGRGGDRDE